MKHLLFTLILCLTTFCYSQNDTLICFVDIISNTPFENDSLIIDEISKITGVQIKVETFKNRHVDGAIDSLIMYSFNSSWVEIYSANSEQWIYNMRLSSSELKTKFGVGVSVSVFDIIGLEQCYNFNKEIKVLVLSELEGVTSLVFEFDNQLIKSISYSGYAD